ncbi:MAG: response regulator [Gemmatimonadota bacterium]
MIEPAVELLLVEDDPGDAELILLFLAEEGVTKVRHVHDGEEALEFLRGPGAHAGRVAASLPRVIFLDLKLPKVSGLEVLLALREDPRTARIPVVMLTSSGLEQDVGTAYRLGANSFVQKPVDFERFRETIRLMARYWLGVNERPPGREYGGT